MNEEHKESLVAALNKCFPNTTEKPSFRISDDQLVYTGYDLPISLDSARFTLTNLMEEIRIPVQEDQIKIVDDPSSFPVSGEEKAQVVSFRINLADIPYEAVMGSLKYKIIEDDREHFAEKARDLLYLSERVVNDGTISSQDIAQKLGTLVADIKDRMPEAEQLAFLEQVRASLTSFAEIQKPRRLGKNV